MSPLAFKQSLQSECGQKKRGCPIRLCPRGSQKKNLMDSRVFQGQELSCHWCWGPRTPATCPWRKGQSLERWWVQVCGHFLSRPFVLGNTGLCPHLRQSWGCAHVGVWAHAGGPARLIWTRGSPLPLLALGDRGPSFESFCLCVSERWPVLSSWEAVTVIQVGAGFRWPCHFTQIPLLQDSL